MIKLNEEHVIASCLAVSYDRDVLGISAYFQLTLLVSHASSKTAQGVTMHPQQQYIDGLA